MTVSTMHSKNSLKYIHTSDRQPPQTNHSPLRKQRGVTLVELMVGVAIGLLVVAVAMSALMVSRGVSGTVSDASGLQQQAAYAMRLIAKQMRQAGSLYLNPTPSVGSIATDPLTAVAFETDAKASGGVSFSQENTIKGDDTAKSVTSTFRRYKDSVFAASTPQSMVRNCLGGPDDNSGSTDEAFENIFKLNGTQLECGGNGSAAQPIIQNVAQFQVTYLEQILTSTGTTIKPVTASTVSNWRAVQGVEVCLVLYGSEPIDMPANSNYTDCDGTTVVDMSSAASKDMNGNAIGTQRAKRMHMTFRSAFQLRSQGLI